MKREDLPYEADGLTMAGKFFCAEDGPARRPGVLVFPEGPGMSDHTTGRAERLAGMGYAVLACDLHGGGQLLADMGEMMARLGELNADRSRIRARAAAALAALAARDEVDAGRIAAIGFCFGGTMSLELARSGADIRAVVGFHSGLAPGAPDEARAIRAKVLVCLGADDPMIPAASRTAFEEEMRAGGVDWRMHLYGGVVHSFTNPAIDARQTPGLRYDAGADRRSWAEMTALFDEVFA